MFQQLTTEANQIVKSLFNVEDISVEWQKPKEATHGDITTIVALKIARATNVKPQEIAAQIAKDIMLSPSVERAEVAGAGYVNVWLKPAALLQELESTVEACVGKKIRKDDAPIIIDYSSPNIAKPLGIHHILSTVIGQTIVNLYTHDGQPMIRWNYLGDWGTQFGKLAVAFEKWGEKKPVSSYSLDELLALYVRFHNEAEHDPSLEQAGQEAFKKLENGDVALRLFWEEVVKITKNAMGDIYRRLQVSFDIDRGESYYEDKMATIVEEGKKKGVFVEGENGALIVAFSEETKLPPAVVVKGDGATLYMTRDLALMKDRFEGWHPKSILWAVDVAQQLYFKQLFTVVERLGWNPPHLEHVFFGRMRFADSAMSTRKGNILKLEEVIDEAVKRAEAVIKERGDAIHTDDPKDLAEMMGIGALVYGILSQNRKMDMVFDWDKMLSFEGNSAPYLMYTHARAMSILRKAGVEIGDWRLEIGVTELSLSERILIGTLLQYSHVLNDARSEHLPHKLANYLYQLCQDFNLFYNTENILQSESPQRDLRLSLTSLTASVLKSGAALLTLRVPDRM